ncbi:YheC/YheD family endospore coat-associated protein [Paenibacillus xylaniclasticus]|uniref:YheC/YheD family endospore coat-associated protein n=1 Tax=Paenibacillus xylaniclasticus TaxID=588083 RepID=UPI000FD967DD|nr:MULTISPECIES: YheC/YheD family protein [Paenibacillus]GFN30883.1 hypothetical protein PCURB6_11430 [Paenibacillus curdlanolyticus]
MDRTLRTIAVLVTKLPSRPLEAVEHATPMLRMPEDRLCRMLAAAGAQQRMRVVVIDADSCISLQTGKLVGFELKDGKWKHCSLTDIPTLVYDRSFAASGRQRLQCRIALRALKEAGALSLSSGLPGKWTVHQALNSDPLLSSILAPTWLYRSEELPMRLIHYPQGLFLKPSSGTQGRGAICVRKDTQGAITIEGRTRSNRTFRFTPKDDHQSFRLIDRFIGPRRYLTQPLLPLTDSQGKPHDVRLLVQKNHRSQWVVTGAVCRIGHVGSVTSNLHGGGTADRAEARLTQLYGNSKAHTLLKSIQEAGLRAAGIIEQHFGRFAEFGFDFGLSPDGKLWLLEANSKPGRQSFKLIEEEQTERLSYTRLLAYARKLADCKTPNLYSVNTITRSNRYALFPSDYVQEVHP